MHMKNTPHDGSAPAALEVSTWFLGGMRELLPGVPDAVLKDCICVLVKGHQRAGADELDKFMASLPGIFRRVGYEEWPPLSVLRVGMRLFAQGWRSALGVRH